MALRQRLALGALLLLIVASVYGFFHQHLLAEPLLTPDGQIRLLYYTLSYWAAAGVLLCFAPRWLGVAAVGFVAAYTFWWSGPAALLAVLYFLGACFLTGRILVRRSDAATATVLGLAAWISFIWLALHFPVNTRLIYAAAFAIPYLWEARRLRGYVHGFRWRCASRSEAAGLAVLLFLLLAHWLIALKPEVSTDGLAMHLELPMRVAQEARWPFDFQRETWSLMPLGGDCVFTAAYLLGGESGGEAAAKLTNFALLALIAAMIARTSRRWLPPGRALLVAALFASTPLVELVTGSVLVENVWAVLILGGALALVRYDEDREAGGTVNLQIAGALFGAALAVKLLAAAFVIPAAMVSSWIALRRRNFRALFSASCWTLLLAAPPYLYAFLRSGNPVFPFVNTLFRSPYFDVKVALSDPRFVMPLSWHMPYDLTFRSGLFFEGQAGSFGFQYFLLLAPAVFLLRNRAQWLILAIGAGGAAIVLAVLPYLRYLYPALPLLSIVIGVVVLQWPRSAAAFTALTALNLWFLSVAGWYHQDFALFHKQQAAEYLRNGAPVELIQRLNREAPGEAAAFFSTEQVAGLHGDAYSDSWHFNPYWLRLKAATNTQQILEVLREYKIHHIIAPASDKLPFPVMERFLREWTVPDGPASGYMALFRLSDVPAVIVSEPETATTPPASPPSPPALPPPAKPAPPPVSGPFPAGAWDDLDPRVEYHGAWLHDRQFSQTLNGSVSYSGVPGDSLRFRFDGSGITYLFTEAGNRGTALVLIDEIEVARIEMYSPETKWRQSKAFDGLGKGTHTFEVRVLDTKDPRSSGTFVDLDGIVVRP